LVLLRDNNWSSEMASTRQNGYYGRKSRLQLSASWEGLLHLVCSNAGTDSKPSSPLSKAGMRSETELSYYLGERSRRLVGSEANIPLACDSTSIQRVWQLTIRPQASLTPR